MYYLRSTITFVHAEFSSAPFPPQDKYNERIKNIV